VLSEPWGDFGLGGQQGPGARRASDTESANPPVDILYNGLQLRNCWQASRLDGKEASCERCPFPTGKVGPDSTRASVSAEIASPRQRPARTSSRPREEALSAPTPHIRVAPDGKRLHGA